MYGVVQEASVFSERQLVQQWLRLLPGTVLYNRGGRPLLILDPGRRNRHAGPDILDAKFFYQQAFVTGAVECHLHENNWWSHGHHRDPRYAPVVLHVVRQLAPRHPVPCTTVVLLSSAQTSRRCGLTAQNLVSYPERPLWRGSIHRWWKKVQDFRTQRAEKEAALLRACFRVLGAGGNEAAFESLARFVANLPLRSLTSNVFEHLLKETDTHLKSGWKLCGVRPHHRPQRRLKLAAALVSYLGKWRRDYRQNPTEFQRAFYDSLRSTGGTTILTELLGNAFYPYLAGNSLDNGDLLAYQCWYRCWYRLTLPTGYGKYRRQFAPLLGRALLRPFWVWQGFLYLDKIFCGHGHCNLCPLRKDHGRLD